MLAEIDWSVAIATIPVTITAIAGLVVALRTGRDARETRAECRIAHAETNAQVATVGEQVVSAATEAATTAAEVKAAIEAPSPGA